MSQEQSGTVSRPTRWVSNQHQLRRIRKLLLASVAVVTIMGVVGGLRWQVHNGNDDHLEAITQPARGVPRRPATGDGSLRSNIPRVEGVDGHHMPPRLFVITVQTSASPGWCKMLLSHFLTSSTTTNTTMTTTSLSSSSSMVFNIGWGEAYGHAKRPAWILQWASDPSLGLRDDDVVMFMDGSDTMFTGVPMEEILAKFVARTLPSEPPTTTSKTTNTIEVGGNASPALPALLFNAEANCYHQQTFSGPWGVKKGRCILAYDELHRQWAAHDEAISTPTAVPINNTNTRSSIQISKFRYLNAGAWIGRVWAVRKVFTEANRQIMAGRGKFWCDQSIIGGILLSRKYNHRTTMGIDTKNAFFLPTYHVIYKADICPHPTLNETPPSSTSSGGEWRKRVRMCHSGETPALMHFNGKSGGPLHGLLLGNTSWWRQEGEVRSAQVRQVLQASTTTRLVSLTGGVTTKVVPLSTHCPSPQYPQG